jgi:hypothetical protein
MFAHLPYAAVQLPPFRLWVLLSYYGIVVGGWSSVQWYHGRFNGSPTCMTK